MGMRTYLFFFTLSASAIVISGQSTIIPPITVKASHKAQPGLTSGPSTVITQQQLSRSGATTLAQALQHLGGVQQQDTTGNGSQVMLSMRGFGANASSNTLLLVNGIPLTNPDLAPPNLNAIPLHEIEYIEIISGSESVQYGDQAVGGVIQLITRDGTKEEANASCGLGSYDQRQCHFSLSQRYQRVLYNVSFSHLHTENYRDHNDYDQNQLMGKLVTFFPSGKLHFNYSIGGEDMQYPGALTATQVRENRRQASNDINFFKDWNGLFQLQYKQDLNAIWRMDTQLSRRVMHGHGVLYSQFTQSRTTDFLKPEWTGMLGNTTLRNGLEVQNDSYNLNSMLGNTHVNQKKYGLYIITNTPLHPRINVSVGARAAEQHSDVESTNHSINLNRAWASTIGATFNITSTMQGYLRRAESYRFPKADENGSTSPGTHGLRTQRGAAYETGMEWNEENRAAKLGLYQLNLRDEITFDPMQTPQDPFGTNRNLSPTVRRGFTLSGKHSLTPRMVIDTQYNYVNARFQEGINNGNRIPLVSETVWRGGINYQISEVCNAYTEAIYTGNQYPANDDANVSGLIGGYTVYNFHLRYIFKQLTASFRMNNLFNKYYYLYTIYQPSMLSEFFYPAPGRNFTFTATYSFA